MGMGQVMGDVVPTPNPPRLLLLLLLFWNVEYFLLCVCLDGSLEYEFVFFLFSFYILDYLVLLI